MWYASCMIDPQNVIGKPLVVYDGDERRQIGVITHAALKNGSLYVGAKLDLSDGAEIEAVIPLKPEDNLG